MTEPEKKELQIEIDENTAQGIYSNLAFLTHSDRRRGFENTHVWVIDRDGGGLRDLTPQFDRSFQAPVWSADGQAILAGFVPWVGWEDWEVHHGYLFPPGFSRHGLAPADFHALVFWRQLVSEYGRQNAALRVRLAELEVQLGRPAAAPGAGPERGPVVVPFSLDRLDQADPQPAASGRRSVG